MILRDGVTVSCRVEVADLNWWQAETAPVILVLYDGQKDEAFWLYVQEYLDEKSVSAEDLTREQDWVSERNSQTWIVKALPLSNWIGCLGNSVSLAKWPRRSEFGTNMPDRIR